MKICEIQNFIYIKKLRNIFNIKNKFYYFKNVHNSILGNIDVKILRMYCNKYNCVIRKIACDIVKNSLK